MASILFAAPGIERWHLIERLARLLQARGHHVTVLATGATGVFWRAQRLPAWLAGPGGGPAAEFDLAPFAEIDVRLRGGLVPRPSAVARAARPLRALLPALQRLLELSPPDLVAFVDARSGLHRLLHFLARERGCRIVHAGAGLLPGTLQVDGEGIDGDAASCRRSALDYRDGARDEAFLAAALAAWLGEALPPPLARNPFTVPPLGARLWATAAALRRGDRSEAVRALHGWRLAIEPAAAAAADPTHALPDGPFVAVLLQRSDDPRLCLDAPECDPVRLVAAASRSAAQLGPGVRAVVLAADPARAQAALRAAAADAAPVVHRLARAPVALATALAVVTVNHPLAAGALLAGTPVLHLGRAPWAVPGVATATSLDALDRDLPLALETPQATLRERVLTRLLAQDHVWCDPDRPDQNGLLGLAVAFEHALGARAGAPARFPTGPAWPLARPRPAEDG
jgi:hypothetical protein